jgi:hypothetical protein
MHCLCDLEREIKALAAQKIFKETKIRERIRFIFLGGKK